MTRWRVSLALLLALASTQLGCSFLFVEGPPHVEERSRDPFKAGPDCSDSKGFPVMSTVAASIGGGMMLMAAALSTGAPPANATAQQIHDNGVKLEETFWTGLLLERSRSPRRFGVTTPRKKCRDYLGQRSGTDAPWLTPPAPTLAPVSDSSPGERPLKGKASR